MEPVIILAGGLGTRLRGVIKDIPKPMAPVNGQPFLHYIFKYLEKYNVTDVILAVGYKYEPLKDFFGNRYGNITIQYSIEEEPLGTGGGIKKAYQLVNSNAFVLNGDTFFDIDLHALKAFYKTTVSDLALALKPLQNFDRYGTVELNTENRITAFIEKKPMAEGLINGGVYYAHKDLFTQLNLPEKFSLEKDLLEKYVGRLKINGCVFNDYFIDIGIPEDLERAQTEFKEKFE
ncbi:MAG TPA: nucleotidyltransferase family protein [Chitinophagales bacterium]|nr:nucleotidyltransferase family protein [Chitinophagales bacterium]